MSFPWRGMFYDCSPTCGGPDAYYVPGTAIVREPEVPEPMMESAPLGAFTPEGQWVPGPPGPGLLPAPWCPARAAMGFGQDESTATPPTEGSTAGKWIVGLSLGLSVALFVGTLVLRPGKG